MIACAPLTLPERSPARFTAYYMPTIDVSRRLTEEFRFPIYGLPDSRRLRRLPRWAIDFRGALAGHGLEIFYARSYFDVYVLYVEGGGRVRIHSEEGPSTAYLSYAGDNGRRVRLIDEYMLRRCCRQRKLARCVRPARSSVTPAGKNSLR